MTTPVRFGPIGTAVPAGVLDRATSLVVADLLTPDEVARPVLERLHDRVGIETRHIAVRQPDGSIPLYGVEVDPADSTPIRPGTAARMQAYDRAAAPLAIEAARNALRAAEIDADSITHLVTASCTGFAAPGVDLRMIRTLGLPSDVARTHIGFMGCHAAVNAVRVGTALARESARHRVLVACVEVSSVHFHAEARLDRVISNLLFADGAAAVVLDTDSSATSAPIVLDTRATVIPDSQEAMAWHVGDHGFEMTLAAEVPDRLAASIGVWVDAALADHGLDRAAVGGWAIHPGGPRVIDAVQSALDLPDAATAASRDVLRERGNMSSGTLLHILQRLADAGTPRPWVGLAFGPGLAGEMIVIA